MGDDKSDDVQRDNIITELLLRVSSLEKLLIDKKVITAKEFGAVFEASVKKMTDIIKEQEANMTPENTNVFVPAKLKN